MAAQPPTEAEQKEAEQYWGYMINPDRTGTNNFKNLLRGLHNQISSTFEPYDSSDLTPTQLARFYRACYGNYDQLFLSTPPATIAFIYKSLGCSHSLQPPQISPSEPRYSDPVIPALKAEGWVVWSTIQLLLAPDEHADFLRHAVSKWDIKIPGTNDTFPKTLPRSCFPQTPDPTMQAWYDSMTERLRKEAEEEEKARFKTVEDRPDSPTLKHHRLRESRHAYESDEESSPDSPRTALAYFRNPLFRTVDGRPGLGRKSSKRPPLSPRGSQSFVQRGKTAAASVGRVVQNVASPHLWDGHASTKHPKDADHRRHRSLPDRNRYQDDENLPAASSSQDSSTGIGPHSRHQERHSSRRGSRTADSPPSEHAYWSGGGGGGGDSAPHRTNSHRTHLSPDLHHRRSHDAPPSPREYFPAAYDGAAGPRRNSSVHLDPRSANGSPVQGGFVPSVSPLFATHVARGGEVPAQSYRPDPRPSLQKRAEYKSPERTPSSRPGSSREEWSGSDNGGLGRSSSLRIPKGAGSSRYGTPVGGVDGRRYPVPGDLPYRSGR